MKITEPKEGSRITIANDRLIIPDKVQIPYIEGDGIGADITKATIPVVDAAVKKAYNNKRGIIWFELFAGEKAKGLYDNVMPDETLKMIDKYKVILKGPLTTPVGGGIRSLNVFLRQHFDLYACVRPVKYYTGVPSPVLHPERMDVVIFRENTEDVYAGIEWQKDTPEAKEVIQFLKEKFSITLRNDSGIGIKPISETATKRLVKMAIEYAIKNKRKKITLVHKGNIMKFTEGAFKNWGYEVAENEFPDMCITEKELYDRYNGKVPRGKIVINDRIADSMFQQILTRAN
ncbi:MAG: NADP-dependent isocitrate dehydrogenase, partial [Spirochaetes bacterium]|nr:NADP-dependent isocitrate dehydrogenase [Spirochaetota bacterium]